MTPNDRYRLESMESIRKANYEKFNSRRNYEWKLSLSIWTAQSLFIVGLIQPVKADYIFPFGDSAWIFGIIAGIALCLTHAYWSNEVSKRNSFDIRMGDAYLLEMEKLVGLSIMENAIRNNKEISPLSGVLNWSHFSQVLITVLLSILAIIILYAKSIWLKILEKFGNNRFLPTAVCCVYQ